MARPDTTGASSEDVSSRSDLTAQTDQITPAGGDPLRDKVAQRAYERYQSRGGAHGQDQDDWLEAEREVNEGQRNQGAGGSQDAGRHQNDE